MIPYRPTGHPALPGSLFCAIGTPLNDGTWTYTWQNGRQLAGMSKDGVNVSFKYNAAGLRTRKIVNGVMTKYTLHHKNVVHMTKGNDSLHFFYDAQNRPAVVVYNGTAYAYVKNLQGDIVAILDSTGAAVVSYTYDAWGAPVVTDGTMKDTLGALNPFRYRGYVFDEETGLYYLRSRYYNPSCYRFINTDAIWGTGTLLSHNLSCYCTNSPIRLYDPNGFESEEYKLSSIDFLSDGQGREILLHYLYGKGVPFIRNNDKRWTRYMQEAPLCPCCGFPEMTLGEYTRNLMLEKGQGIAEGDTRHFDTTIPMSLMNGESIYGYNYLHGTNSNVGDLHIHITVSRYNDVIFYEGLFTWNDIIDPADYPSDEYKTGIAEKIPFATPSNYVIQITWNESFQIDPTPTR